jgi:hypothetical protein
VTTPLMVTPAGVAAGAELLSLPPQAARIDAAITVREVLNAVVVEVRILSWYERRLRPGGDCAASMDIRCRAI